MSPEDAGAEQADFGRTYWRSASAVPTPLPPLGADAIDDATFRLLADNLPTLAWVANGDGYIVWYNRRWHEYCGTTPAQMEGWGWTSTHDPAVLPSVLARWTASIATGEPFEMTFPLRGADGVLRPFLTRVQPMRDGSGAVARWFGVNTEICDQVAAEAALRAERDRGRDVLDSMGEAFVLLDRAFRVLDINAAGLRVDGRPRAEIVGRVHWEVWPGTEDSDLGRLYKRAVAELVPVAIENRYAWPDGREAWMDVRGYPTADGLAVFYRDVTERKRAKEALETSEAFTRLLLDSTSEAFYAVDRAGVTTLCNRAFLGMLGFADPDEVIGRKLHDVIHHSHPDGSPYPVDDCPIYRAASEGRPAFVGDEVFFRQDGTAFPVEYRAEPILRDGVLQGAICTFSDITERERTQAALRASEARLGFLDRLGAATAALADADAVLAATTRLLGEHLRLSVCAYADMDEDEDGFTIRGDWAAPGSTSIVGHYSLADFGRLAVANLGAGLPLVVADNLAELAPEEAATFQAIGISATICMPLVKDGRLTALMAIHDRVPRAWTAEELDLLRAVTARSWAHVERVGAVAELRRSEAQFRAFAQAMPNHVWASRPDGELYWFNDQVYAYAGVPRGSLDGTAAWTRLIHADDLPAAAEAWARSLATGAVYETEFRIRRADGAERWFLVRAEPVRGPDGAIVNWVGTNTDVEDRRRQGQELAQLNATLEQKVEERTRELMLAEEALRQAQKMEAVGQLTGGIAHDFNNMLAAVIGSLDLLGRRLGTDDARARRYADAAMEGARRAALLTQRLLAFSRQQPLRPEPIAVNGLVAGMSELIRGSIGGDVRLETVLASGLWRTQADPNQLENAILNLAVNARDAMPEGGRLTIETQNAHLDDRYAAATPGVPAGQYVLVAVTDTGTGMTPEVMAKAFDPFFTTKEVGRGTGLGLSQVYGFVRQSGGHVKIYSEPGQGTSVKAYLPRLLGEPADEPDGGAAPGLPLGDGQEVILVVEDEPAVRRISVDALTDLGYRVLEADGAAAALRLLDQHPEVTLLFTDIVMPDLNGRRLAEEARRRRPDLRVLFTTGYTRNALVHNGVLDPGVDLIGKPFTVEDLANKVREVLDRPPETPRPPG